jgi:hypothetical protein
MDLEQMLRWLTLRGLLIWHYVGTTGEGGTNITYSCIREGMPILTWRTLEQAGRLTAVALDAHFDDGAITRTSDPRQIPGHYYLGLYATYLELRLSIENPSLGSLSPDMRPAAQWAAGL